MVARYDRGLRFLLDKIRELNREWLPQVALLSPKVLRRTIEVENSLYTAKLMTLATLLRHESRGSHFRGDYPEQDDVTWRTNIRFCMENATLR